MNLFRHLLPRLTAVALAAVILPGAVALLPAPAFALFPEDGFSDVARMVMPAYVDIVTSQQVEVENAPQLGPEGGPFDEFFRDFFGQLPNGQRRVTAAGSGFILRADGIVVTNNHVIDDADQVAVVLQDGTRLPAVVLGVDDRADLAVLKVDAGYDLPFLRWGDSDAADVGDWALAVGNPFGLGGTLSLGIISARARNINAGPYDDFIQTDAAINRGNSGGPLLSLAGEVIGINTAIFSPTGASVGIGFAIPSNLARPIVDQIIEFGRPRRGWLGVRIQRVTGEIAEGLGIGEPRGALIAGISGDGPAGRAGIQAGDVILKFDGKEIPEMRALTRVVAETQIDKVVDVEIWRDGETRTVQVRVGELTDRAVAALAGPTPDALPNSTDALGMSLAEVTPDLRDQYGLALDADGVLVVGVQAATDAAARRIQPGDVILEVGQDPVRAPADVVRLVQAARDDNRSSVLILLQERDGDLRFVALSLEQG